MKSKLRRLFVLGAIAAAATAAACSKDKSSVTDPPVTPPGDTNASPSGTLPLTSVDTKSLPYAVLSDTFYKLEVTAGSAVLQTNGQFLLPLTTRETVAGAVSTYVDTTRGTWTQSGGAISMTVAPDNSTTHAVWDGKHLTLMFVIGGTTNTYLYTHN